jgi:hypothetical protein
MDFERQKPVTNEYRDGWDRIFGSLLRMWSEMPGCEIVNVPASNPTYPNGCPILEERADG